MRERRRLRRPGWWNAKAKFRRGRAFSPIADGGTLQIGSQRFQRRSGPCRARAIARRLSWATFPSPTGAAAEIDRSVRPRIRIPSRPVRCESTQAEFALPPDNRTGLALMGFGFVV